MNDDGLWHESIVVTNSEINDRGISLMTADFVRTMRVPIVGGCLDWKVDDDEGRLEKLKEFIPFKQFEEDDCGMNEWRTILWQVPYI